ncbi:MAG: CPXCG motif-containing cysteine-rich protein [Ignavibacteria bacterium]|nr:CPXCG motif-containing cysteine-rich protein [Ignavibacteria bacterium]
MEYFFTCPYCWQEISFILDITADKQKYIEDCEVCCRPIEVYFEISENDISFFKATEADN